MTDLMTVLATMLEDSGLMSRLLYYFRGNARSLDITPPAERISDTAVSWAKEMFATPEGKALASLVEAALIDDGFTEWQDEQGTDYLCWSCSSEKHLGHDTDCPLRAYREATYD